MKPDKERTRDANDRKKARGLVPLYKWVHKDDKPAIVAFIETLKIKRETS